MSKPERRDALGGTERRIVTGTDLKVETRAAGGVERKVLVGHASVFDRPTTLYEGRYLKLVEVVRPGAYARAIRERQDVRSLFNHDANFVLGRTSSGTLRLSEDRVGLLSETDPPDSQTIRDLVLTPVGRGDVSGMSFAFQVKRSEEVVTTQKDGRTVVDNGGERITIWLEGDKEFRERELRDLDLVDVSPVTYPAYPETDIALRSLIERRDRPHRSPWHDQVRERLRRAQAPR